MNNLWMTADERSSDQHDGRQSAIFGNDIRSVVRTHVAIAIDESVAVIDTQVIRYKALTSKEDTRA